MLNSKFLTHELVEMEVEKRRAHFRKVFRLGGEPSLPRCLHLELRQVCHRTAHSSCLRLGLFQCDVARTLARQGRLGEPADGIARGDEVQLFLTAPFFDLSLESR